MIANLVEGYRQWLESLAQTAGALFGVPIPGPPPEAIPDTPHIPRRWDVDEDVWAEACELQAEWVALRGSGDPARLRVMRRYHAAVGDLFPHAA